MILREHVPLAPLTTLGLGGPARWFTACESLEDLREALRTARSRRWTAVIIGGGSNLIVPDEGFGGLVIAMNLRGVTVTQEGGYILVRAAAGEPWDKFVTSVVDQGWGGLECLSGIPGLVGATPIQNVGAYGQEVAETIAAVEVLNRETLECRLLAPDACAFGYRKSAFKSGDLQHLIVIGVTFRLRPNAPPVARYPELQRFIESSSSGRPLPAGTEGLRAVREAVLHLRRRKSMVVDPADPHTRSVGSFFTNPILTAGEYRTANALWKKSGSSEAIPSFPAGREADGPGVERLKVPAAWLVEHAGFVRGYREGGVGISANHALALVNYGGTTKALLTLAGKIQITVKEKFQVTLEREPVVLQ